MALGATIYNFQIDLANNNRHVYESLTLRVARHPSESEEYLIARLLAYLLEFTSGIEFSRGVSDPEQPAIAVRDATGAITTWIDIGTPDAARLHKASKAAARVVVYTHKEPAQLLRALDGERIHRAEVLELYGLDRPLIAELLEHRDRRTKFDLTVTEGHVYVTIDGETLEGIVEKIAR